MCSYVILYVCRVYTHSYTRYWPSTYNTIWKCIKLFLVELSLISKSQYGITENPFCQSTDCIDHNIDSTAVMEQGWVCFSMTNKASNCSFPKLSYKHCIMLNSAATFPPHLEQCIPFSLSGLRMCGKAETLQRELHRGQAVGWPLSIYKSTLHDMNDMRGFYFILHTGITLALTSSSYVVLSYMRTPF